MHLLKRELRFSSQLCLLCPAAVSVQAVHWEAQQAALSPLHDCKIKNRGGHEGHTALRGDKISSAPLGTQGHMLCQDWSDDSEAS